MTGVEDDGMLLRSKLDASLERNRSLEKENEKLKQDVLHLKGQITLLRAQDSDRRSVQWKKVQSSFSNNCALSPQDKKTDKANDSFRRPEISSVPQQPSKERFPRVPKQPPKPSSCQPSMPKPTGKEARFPPLPPPPPLFTKRPGVSINAVRRVPEVVEFYRCLTKGDGKHESRTSFVGMPVATNSREMIGEIENRSAYLIAIKSDVETQGEFINFLIKEVENADYKEMSDVEAFVEWLDEELSFLVDERAVLKHFPHWPEKKADATREAACSYRELKQLASEVSAFQDDLHQSMPNALRRMQALQDKLEQRVHNLERVRENTIKKYKDLKIPWEWMLDSGIISQLKLGSMKLAKLHMTRVVTALQSEGTSEDEDLTLQGVRFAFRVHQFVGGFDEESKRAFEQLRQLARGAICD